MRLLLLTLLQCALLLWLHYRTLWHNVAALRRYVAAHPPPHPHGEAWVNGGEGGYSFPLCHGCVHALVHHYPGA